VPLLLWHVVVDLPLTLLLASPPLGGLRWGSEPVDHRLFRLWQAGLMRIFGFRLHREGMPLPGAVVFVANHVSWIDIVALHSQRMMGFVAKREISQWPLVGWMATRGETIFHERGSSESLGGVLHEMLARLRDGRSVGVFPEGRTRDGREVGPFHARIFLAAVEAGARVQPVALRYGEHGAAQATVAFAPGEGFGANFLRLLGEPARRADIVFLEPIDAGDAGGRRRIAELARERIVEAMAR
jgi:1-acyl-sn-glycerol-3-phosphate acyltransferase